MPPFRSSLRNSYNFQGSVKGSRDTAEDKEERTTKTDYKRRGNSLPTNCSSVTLRLLPSLRHSLTDTDICKQKVIPKDIIETDYLLPSSSDENQIPDNRGGITESNRDSAETDSIESEVSEIKLQSDTCLKLRKALLDGLDQRVIRAARSRAGGENYSLFLNADLLDRVSLDIVRMSHREPSGLSGCRLRTRVERQHSADMDLGCLKVNADAKETFEIVLSLRECQKTSDKFHSPKTVSSLLSTFFRRPTLRSHDQPIRVYVGDAYQLEKIKLHDDSFQSHNALLCNS